MGNTLGSYARAPTLHRLGLQAFQPNLAYGDQMFGFIEAYVVCLKSIKKPFLPYIDKNKTLIFPTRKFVGVYYSELKYTRVLGCTVILITGYLF